MYEQQLAESWNAIAIQTNWKLESLLTFADEQLETQEQSPANYNVANKLSRHLQARKVPVPMKAHQRRGQALVRTPVPQSRPLLGDQ